MKRLTRNCEIKTNNNLSQELNEMIINMPKYDFARNDNGFQISKTQDILDKLGQLEDIEEELGIDLITLFKAFKNGIWSKGGWYEACCIDNESEFVKPEDIRLGKTTYLESKYKDDLNFSTYEKNQLCLFDMDYEDEQHVVKVKDYGKTWALTKEDLL